MNINKNNYKSYLSLYLERKLDPMKTAELMVFFSENPDIEKQHDISSDPELQPDDTVYAGKDMLKKSFTDIPEINTLNFDEFCIASAENLLDDIDETRLKSYIIQHPEKGKDANVYRQLRVKPDLKIRFPDKSAIRKPVFLFPARKIILSAFSIAAAVILILLITTDKPEAPETPVSLASQNSAPAIMEHNTAPAENTLERNTIPQASFFAEEHTEIINKPETSNTSPSEIIPREIHNLPQIEPLLLVELETRAYSDNITLRNRHNLFHALYGVPANNQQDSEEDMLAGNNLIDYIRGLDAWKTTLIAVKGFNFLTESNLSIEKTTDEEGRIKELTIDTEEFTLLSIGSK